MLAAFTVTAFVLGYVGFREYFDEAGIAKSTSDVVYLSLQLFTLESGSVPATGAPWQLEVARLAAPAASATALIAAVSTAFSEQIREWRLGRTRNHVVVCGLGTAGTRLVTQLLDAGQRVVGIEADGLNPAIVASRHRGAAVIVGDARDRDTLRRARLARAAHLVCLTGSDETNAEVVLDAMDLVAERQGPGLSCLARIRDPDLCVLMRSDELAASHPAGTRLDFFNIDEQGARLMLRDFSPFPADELDDGLTAVMVVGLNRLGQTLVAELARQWRAHPTARGRPIDITVVDPDANTIIDRLCRRYPQLDHAANINPVVAAIDPVDTDAIGESAAKTIYICIDDDSRSVRAGLAIQRCLEMPDALIVVELSHTGALGRLVDRPTHSGRIRAFSVLDRTMQTDLLLGGTYEILARATHEEYVAQQRLRGARPETNPSMAPWEKLAASLKESNRDQAGHIGTKLAAIGRGIAPLTDWDAHEVTFTDAEVEMLSEMEHERWVHERRRNGWTSGPRDVDAKTSPYLVPWNELSDGVKEQDRQAVRGIPAFLARAGYQIVSYCGGSSAR